MHREWAPSQASKSNRPSSPPPGPPSRGWSAGSPLHSDPPGAYPLRPGTAPPYVGEALDPSTSHSEARSASAAASPNTSKVSIWEPPLCCTFLGTATEGGRAPHRGVVGFARLLVLRLYRAEVWRSGLLPIGFGTVGTCYDESISPTGGYFCTGTCLVPTGLEAKRTCSNNELCKFKRCFASGSVPRSCMLMAARAPGPSV